MLVKGLSEILPGTGFIAEENPDMELKDLNWIIDPLDGTTNFIHGVPVYSISIALMDKKEVILGVILEVNQNECFYTWKGSPSYLNGQQIRVSDTARVADSLLATGFPYYDFSRLDDYLRSLQISDAALSRYPPAWLCCSRYGLYGLWPF